MSNSMNELLKQAQTLQSKLTELQAEAEHKTVEASSGGGMVTAVVNGKLQLVRIHIEPQIAEGGDREMLEDLVVAAVNEAIRKAQQMMAEAMTRVTGGLKIPGLGG
ncbi:MAG: YbaB/EbfC family nucleoid-associated protein [Candidatus Binatia bacterium]|jgi:DNA-binding YbaB/EbfC family protein